MKLAFFALSLLVLAVDLGESVTRKSPTKSPTGNGLGAEIHVHLDPKGKEVTTVWAAAKHQINVAIRNAPVERLTQASRTDWIIDHRRVGIFYQISFLAKQAHQTWKTKFTAFISMEIRGKQTIYKLNSLSIDPFKPRPRKPSTRKPNIGKHTTKRPEQGSGFGPINPRGAEAKAVYQAVKGDIIGHLSRTYVNFKLSDGLSEASSYYQSLRFDNNKELRTPFKYDLAVMVKLEKEKKPKRYLAVVEKRKLDGETIFKLLSLKQQKKWW